ncbi:MAG: hypothetical protein AAFQ94_19650 [Bacteroidota bacterium]
MSGILKCAVFPATLILSLIVLACGEPESNQLNESSVGDFADVVNVSVSGSAGEYTFAVTISSPDTGCEQYADWWEIISEDEALIYRRILRHSHVNEQPFVRSGGPVNIASDQKVWVRAHMNNVGYGGRVYYGSVEEGFEIGEMPEAFAWDLVQEQPLPDGCDF